MAFLPAIRYFLKVRFTMTTDDTPVYHFRGRPGPRERQLKRRHNNPLFGDAGQAITQAEVNAARMADMDELEQFTNAMRELVDKAMNLPPRAESEVILELKETADRLYEQRSGLGGEMEQELAALARLTQVIMKAVWAGAGNDPVARAELESEEEARASHFELLKYPLICDLLNPESPVEPEELAATLLSEDEQAVRRALGPFEVEQRAEVLAQAEDLAARHTLKESQARMLDVVRELAAVRPH
ncbi:MAG: hypothetical protein ACPGU7_06940 [Gammaproteobacteria bacterium]